MPLPLKPALAAFMASTLWRRWAFTLVGLLAFGLLLWLVSISGLDMRRAGRAIMGAAWLVLVEAEALRGSLLGVAAGSVLLVIAAFRLFEIGGQVLLVVAMMTVGFILVDATTLARLQAVGVLLDGVPDAALGLLQGTHHLAPAAPPPDAP